MADARTKSIQQRFSSGFLDEQLLGRIDIEQYRSGCRQATNILTLPQGPARRRPGDEFIEQMPGILTLNATAATMPEGGTAANIHDNDPTTEATTTTNIGVVNPYVVAHYDLGSAVAVKFVDVTNIRFDASGTSDEFIIQWSSDDAAWNDLFVFASITAVAQDRREPGVTAQFWRIARVGATDLGTLKITLADFLMWGESTVFSNVRQGDFELSDDDKYLVSLTDKNLRIYKDNSRLIDLGATYTAAEVKAIGHAQQDLAFIIVHEDHPPARLIRGADDTAWALTDIPFTNVPQFDFNDGSSPTPTSYICTLTFTDFTEGDRFQIELDTALTEVITWTTNAAALIANVTKFVQDLFLLGDTGVSVAGTAPMTLTLADASAGAFEQMIAFPTSAQLSTAAIVANRTQPGVSRKEAVWSAGRGFPRNVAFFQSRMYFAGTKAKPQSLFGSRVGRFFDFETGEGFDDDAIFITINTKTRNTLESIVPARVLQLFASGGEFSISQKPITPTNVTPDPQTNHGSSSVDPVEIDGSTLFIERKGRTLREFLFSFNEQGFLGASLSFLAQSLINTPVDMAALKGRTSDDSNYVFIVNTDGTMAVYNVLRSQGVAGFTKWITGESVAGAGVINTATVVDDVFYLCVTRTIDSVVRNYLEFFSEDVLMDCAVRKTQGTSAVVTGADHLEGETVRVKLDGAIMDDATVSSGGFTMERGGDAADSIVEFGLNYVPTLQPMPVSNDPGFGENQMSIKKIIETILSVKDSAGIKIGINDSTPILIPDRAFGEGDDSPLDTIPTPRTAVIPRLAETIGFSEERLQSVTITQDDPLPMTILSIETIVAG